MVRALRRRVDGHSAEPRDEELDDETQEPVAAPARRRVHLPLYVEFVRPVTVGDCRGGPRPCPLVTCEFHLGSRAAAALPDDVSDEEVERLLRAMPHTCAQDVIDAYPEGADLRVIGEVFGISHERVRQLEARTLRKYLRGRAERANLREHVDLDEGHLAPWERERQTKGGGYARHVETPEPHAAPPHLAHLPLVADVHDAGESFWCGWIRAEMPATRCVSRQLARSAISHGAPTYHGCASCDAGRELTARVRVRSDVETTCNAPRPALEPRTTMTETAPTIETPATHPGDASAPTSKATKAPKKLCKCGDRPPAGVTKNTRPGEEELCASCRRINGMALNGTTTGGYHPKKEAAPVEQPVKRGPGRPRKDATTAQSAPKRGRPPKSTAQGGSKTSKAATVAAPKSVEQTLPKDPATRIAWAARAFACAVKVGGIDRLEAFVSASIEHGLLA